MNKTGLERMVEWLLQAGFDVPLCPDKSRGLWKDDVLRMAKETLIEEQAQKHTDTEESLAELADRKGCDKMEIYMRTKEEPCMIFFYGFESDIENEHSPAIGETYTKAESEARKYLNDLPDKDTK